ncbi:hypothetical protein Ahy_B02g057413 isoform D [Arachis hypogaea]|uniref:Uncharacterized protein n=1 Tax=Arachis hypogaea TaxID=3818 RepID=A0A445ABR5_ARAHY|nr:hypothetical protein Ahy_B02g057413 isoform D [Arachis hypogaea]
MLRTTKKEGKYRGAKITGMALEASLTRQKRTSPDHPCPALEQPPIYASYIAAFRMPAIKYRGTSPLRAIISLKGAPKLIVTETIVTLNSLILAAKVPVPTLKSNPILISPGLIPRTSVMRKSDV